MNILKIDNEEEFDDEFNERVTKEEVRQKRRIDNYDFWEGMECE